MIFIKAAYKQRAAIPLQKIISGMIPAVVLLISLQY